LNTHKTKVELYNLSHLLQAICQNVA